MDRKRRKARNNYDDSELKNTGGLTEEDQSAFSLDAEDSALTSRRDKNQKNAADAPLFDDDLKTAGASNGNNGKKKGKRNWKKTSLIVVLSVLFVLCSVGAGVFFYFRNAIIDPTSQFTPPAGTPLPSGASIEDIKRAADQAMLQSKGIINIMLIGVDYAVERETWTGKHAYHADVMMILAVDFINKKVDMISLPRDTYAKIPGVQGIYKLNASLDCGGGFPDGLTKVCEAAEWMLGGTIPVDYYYAVTMPVVKELVDAIGGVTYDIDIDFTMGGRTYQKGVQLMNGQAVLDYLRVRKNLEDNSQEGDKNRVIRQKKMLVAVFKKMQEQNLWVNLPKILSAFSGKLFTNTTAGQTAALAALAYDLKEENITMRTIGGSMRSVFNWNFCITDQAKRVQTIKDVYGITVPKYSEYDLEYVLKKWARMMYEVYEPNTTTLINYVQTMIDNGTVPTPSPTPVPTPVPTIAPSATPTTVPTGTPGASTLHVSGAAPDAYDIYQKFLEVKTQILYINALLGKATLPSPLPSPTYSGSQGERMVKALNDLKLKCKNLAALVNNPLKADDKWAVVYENQIEVDFR